LNGAHAQNQTLQKRPLIEETLLLLIFHAAKFVLTDDLNAAGLKDERKIKCHFA